MSAAASGLQSLDEAKNSETSSVRRHGMEASDSKRDTNDNKIKLEEDDDEEDDDDDEDEDTAGNNADMDMSDATNASKRNKPAKDVEEEVPMTFPQKVCWLK
jgi:hypothetical protein